MLLGMRKIIISTIFTVCGLSAAHSESNLYLTCDCYTESGLPRGGATSSLAMTTIKKWIENGFLRSSNYEKQIKFIMENRAAALCYPATLDVDSCFYTYGE